MSIAVTIIYTVANNKSVEFVPIVHLVSTVPAQVGWLDRRVPRNELPARGLAIIEAATVAG